MCWVRATHMHTNTHILTLHPGRLEKFLGILSEATFHELLNVFVATYLSSAPCTITEKLEIGMGGRE